MAALGVTSFLVLPTQALAAPECVAKDVIKESGKVESITLLVSKKSVGHFLAQGFSVANCSKSRVEAKKLEKLFCEATKSESGPMKRSLEAHFQMSVDELCRLTREAIKEK